MATTQINKLIDDYVPADVKTYAKSRLSSIMDRIGMPVSESNRSDEQKQQMLNLEASYYGQIADYIFRNGQGMTSDSINSFVDDLANRFALEISENGNYWKIVNGTAFDSAADTSSAAKSKKQYEDVISTAYKSGGLIYDDKAAGTYSYISSEAKEMFDDLVMYTATQVSYITGEAPNSIAAGATPTLYDGNRVYVPQVYSDNRLWRLGPKGTFECYDGVAKGWQDTGIAPQTTEEKDQRTYAIANTFNVWISDVVHTMFGIMTGNFNVDPEIGKRLNMKSEVLYSRIVFVDVKKRYLGKMKLKEGNVVPPKKQADFKGFDFMKSTTKPFLKEYYIKLSMEKILSPDVISPRDVFRAILLFKRQIEEDLENGETKYYKQANIKRIEEYAERAYSTQGIKAVTLWNTLNPDYQIQLPSDVDIVPMRWEEGRKTKEGPKVIQDHYVYIGKKLKKAKDGGVTEVDVYQDNDTPVLRELQEKYPETYQILNDRIFHNENPNIRKMGIQWMAKPKNPNIPVPAWYYDFVDSATIVDDALKLYYPVLESIGLNIAKVSTNKTCLTNMVSL